MAPYSILGISMLLIVSVAIYHFNNVDIQKAQERNALTMDMETFYSTVKVGQDLQQVARVSVENVILDDSMATYSTPVDVNSDWANRSDFEDWKNKTAIKIKEQAEKEIFDFYYGGDKEALEKQYYNPSTDFNFENFIKAGGIKVSVTPDSYDPLTKTQNALELTVGFKDGGEVSAKNKFTGYELTMTAGTNVSVDARPFTMADKAYEFTEKFNNEDAADDIAWRMWWVQTAIGNVEANAWHNVKFATDDRATYSIMQVLVAIEEMDTFGTFDYWHTADEIRKPWIGAEEEANEFFSLLSLSMEESNVDQAIASMDAAEFVHNVSINVQDISNSMILASSYIDSETVTEAGFGFESSEVKKVLTKLPEEGTLQHLENANDTQKLNDAYAEIVKKLAKVTNSKNNVEDGTVDSLSVVDQISDLDDEYNEVRIEWEKAESGFSRSQDEIISISDGYSSLNLTFNNEICENPIAAMLWFGDSNQNVKGFKDIITAKVSETDELVEYYRELEKNIRALSYESVKDSYDIDRHYNSANRSLNEAEVSVQIARSARIEYLDQKYKYDNCKTHVDDKDPEMGSCLGSGYNCKPYSCNPHRCNCKIEIDDDGDISFDCDTCWDTCYRTCYDCICDKEVLKSNYEKANETYVNQMRIAEHGLTNAASEVSSLQTQIDTFFTENGIENVYDMAGNAHGMYKETTNKPLGMSPKPYSISDNYYSHWDYQSCSNDHTTPSRKYVCAKNLIQYPHSTINETNYNKKMPPSLLTYDAVHEDYSDYGLYYIKFMIDKMDETFEGSSINANELGKAKAELEEMKKEGFFAKMNAVLKPVKELVDSAGDITSAIAKVKNADAEFPNSREHFYTILPLPVFNLSWIGIENQGFSVVHDIRLRADTSPGEIKIPFIKKPIPLGVDSNEKRVSNPSFPIPYTPIFVYLWQFDVTPSKVKDNGDLESSMLWLIDTKSSQVAPLMEMKVDDEIFDVPLYLHKPTMYKYEFTPNQTFTKKIDLNKLPPVFVLAAGPFRTRFGPYYEPPDKEITENPIPIDVSFDREFADESAKMSVSTTWDNIVLSVNLTEAVSLESLPVSESLYINTPDFDYKKDTKKIPSKDLKLLNEYGWSELKADAYATEISFTNLLLNNIKGEDHARVYFIDPNLQSIGIKLEKEKDALLKITNTGNKKVDVSVDPIIENTCTFIFDEGNLSKSWIGSIDYNKSVNLTVSPKHGTKITAKVLIPEKVKEELEQRGIQLKLEDQT